MSTDLQLTDIGICALGPALMLLSALCGRKTWLKMEIVLSVIAGIIVFAKPELFLSYQIKGSVDNYHLFLSLLYGSYIIYAVLFPLYLLSSKDDGIFFSHFWAKLVSSTLMLINVGFSYFGNEAKFFNHKLLWFSGSSLFVSILINGFYMATSKKAKGSPHEFVNIVAKIEAFMLCSAGLILFAFPDWGMLGLANPNESHRFICRHCGAMLFSLCFESFCVSDLNSSNAKKSFMLARLIGSLLELVVILIGFYQYKVFTEFPGLAIYLFINISYNMLVILGYFSAGNSDVGSEQKTQSRKVK